MEVTATADKVLSRQVKNIKLVYCLQLDGSHVKGFAAQRNIPFLTLLILESSSTNFNILLSIAALKITEGRPAQFRKDFYDATPCYTNSRTESRATKGSRANFGGLLIQNFHIGHCTTRTLKKKE